LIRVQSTRPTIKLLPFVLFGSAPPLAYASPLPGKWGGLEEEQEQEPGYTAAVRRRALRVYRSALVSRYMLAGMKGVVVGRSRRIGRVSVRQGGWLKKRGKRESSMGVSSGDAAGRWLAEVKRIGPAEVKRREKL